MVLAKKVCVIKNKFKATEYHIPEVIAIDLSFCLSVCVCVCLSVFMSVCKPYHPTG